MQEIQKFRKLEREGVVQRDTNLERNGVDESTEIERDVEYNIEETMPVLKDAIELAERNKNFKTISTKKSEEYSEICKGVVFKEVGSQEDISRMESSVENFREEVVEDNFG